MHSTANISKGESIIEIPDVRSLTMKAVYQTPLGKQMMDMKLEQKLGISQDNLYFYLAILLLSDWE